MPVENHVRDVWDPTYNVAYPVVFVIGWQFELMYKSGDCKVNVQDI